MQQAQLTTMNIARPLEVQKQFIALEQGFPT